jgi:hypothetical protein
MVDVKIMHTYFLMDGISLYVMFLMLFINGNVEFTLERATCKHANL